MISCPRVISTLHKAWVDDLRDNAHVCCFVVGFKSESRNG